MTPTPAPDAAVQIAVSVSMWETLGSETEDTLNALARTGWLTPPDRRVALEAVAKTGQAWREQSHDPAREVAHRRALAALDALPPADGPEPAPVQGGPEPHGAGYWDAYNVAKGQPVKAIESALRAVETTLQTLRRAVSRGQGEINGYRDALAERAVPAAPQPATGDDSGREQ